jgi:hypothetical protein
MPVLNFPMQQQQMSEWCWAAVASSTSVFFRDPSVWRQCDLASDQLSVPNCCTAMSVACNRQWLLEAALSRIAHLNAVRGVPGSLSAVSGEIDAGRPVGARIQWRGSGAGHFVVVEGYDLAQNLCFVRDSLFGPSAPTFETLRTNYLGRGFWSHSYLMR